MKTTNYAGINYAGPTSSANKDSDTGIRYGVISQNAVMGEATEEIYSRGTDLGYEDYIATVKQGLRSALSDYFSDHKWDGKPSKLDDAVESAFDAVSDGIGDNYSNGESGPMRLESDGLCVQTDSSNDLWVFKSPFFTYAQFCSPCAPGACYLTSPLDSPNDDNKCYCLGSDWFEDGKAPYPIYSVETGKLA